MGACWVISNLGYRDEGISVVATKRYFSSLAERTRRGIGK